VVGRLHGHDAASSAGASDEVSLGIRAGVVAYVVWGLLTIYWKQLAHFDAFELIAWRVLCASVVMAAVVTARRRWPVLRAALRTPRLVGRLFVAALLLTVNWGAYVWAVSEGRIIETALGYFMAPLATMLLGILVLHERPTRSQRLALGCAVLAVIVLTVAAGSPPVVALLIAGSWSLYGLLKRQVPLSAIESLAGETFLLTVPALVFAVVAAADPASVTATATAGDWVLVALTGVVTAGPLLLFAVAAQRVPFTILGPLQYLVPTINFLLGWVVYGEELPASRLVGFAFVWVALVLTATDHVRGVARSRRPEPVDGYAPSSAR
jgi:chloramphenicol-sensitive protein RarD